MDLDTILQKWNHAKEQKAKYEKECSDYKGAVERYLNRKRLDKVDGEYFTVIRRSNTRMQLSKESVPVDIWNRYANRITYKSYYLKRRKN